MSTHARSPKRDQYTVGWICAIPEERAAANAMLDEAYENTQDQDAHDTNHYSFGRVKRHNVVIASLPAGVYGTSTAATVAGQMLRSYTSIKIRLMVGIGGGVPTLECDIRLGDVVISQPKEKFGGVVQYDRGKKTAGGKFERTGQLDKPPQLLLNALASMQADFEMQGFDLGKYLRENLKDKQRMLEKYGRPHEKDELYRAEYDHVGANRECTHCDRGKLVPRYPRSPMDVRYHYGTIASGNLVMKHGTERDRISQDLGGILCFEMEAAGLMDNFPCLVIRGICDYADSHKDKGWQRYAALTAAAYAKKLLSTIPGSEQPGGRQYSLPLDGLLPRFTEMPTQQRSSPLNPYTLALGQPMEQSRGAPSDQLSPSFFDPHDPYTTPPGSHQPSPQPRESPFNQSTSGYSHSSSPYGVSPSRQLGHGTGWSSAYPSAATDQGSFEGSSSTLARPSLNPNWTGHSDSDRSRFRANSTTSWGTEKTAVDSQLGETKGYQQSTQMTYPQLPRPSHPDRSRQSSNSHSTSPIPLRPLPPSKNGQLQRKTPGAQASYQSGQKSHGHSVPAIAPHSLPPPRSEQLQTRADGARGSASRGHELTAAGPDSGALKPFSLSHPGPGHATARKQVATKPSSKVPSDQSYVGAQPPLGKDQKTPSFSSNPKPTASACEENSHDKAAEAPAQNHGQQNHPKEAKPSTKSGQGQSHHHDNPKPSAKRGQEPNHHHDHPKPSSENSAHHDHPLKPKSSLESHEASGHHNNKAAQSGQGGVTDATSEYGADETSSNTLGISSESDIKPEFDQEPNYNNDNEEDHHHHHTEPPNGQWTSTGGQMHPYYGLEPPLYPQGYPSNGQESHGSSPYSHLGYPPYSQEYPSHHPGPSPSDNRGYPSDDQEHYGHDHGHEQSRDHPSYGPEHSSYDLQYSSPYDDYHAAGNDLDRAVGGEADEYFSPQDMGEYGYMANPTMAASPYDQNAAYDRPADVQGEQEEDDSSSDGKSREDRSIEMISARNGGQLDGEEEADDDGCGCFDGCFGGCCGGCCGGEEEADDDGCGCFNGCFGGCCGGCCGEDEGKSDDGEGSCACIVM
ncbi:MAG: hypothetical protein LQ346_001186 [Caloplaca aetnensis]|nr:MAG: hypothetical protein LQ346_001186 [Caloplaca aetnensis]